MKPRVYFTPVKDSDDIEGTSGALKRLIDSSGVFKTIREGNKVAVKIHFGEEGNVGYVRPEYARVVSSAIIDKRAHPTLIDTNTLYHGKRANSKDHLETAARHGFTKKTIGAEVFIPEDKGDSVREVRVEGSSIKSAKIAGFFLDADAIVAINHFKGHILAGFGGALKNIGMGCATREGKLAQHCDVAPVTNPDKCTGCGACVNVCPSGAISLQDAKSVVDKARCIGCADCILVCPTNAMFIDMKAGAAVQKKMAEYAAAVIRNKKVSYINFAVRIFQECDCWGAETPRIAPDVGIFASLDPVAVDKASLDAILKAAGKDVFKEAHPDEDGMVQLTYAARLGLGSLDYELIEVR